MKKTTSLFVAGAIALTMYSPNALAYDWENHNLSSGIKRAIERNILSGNKNVYPDKQTTRAEFASMIVKATGVNKESTKKFKDVPSSHPYYQDVSKAYQSGFISGYSESEFKPDQFITREEMILMIHRFIGEASLPNVTNTYDKEFKDINKAQYPYVVTKNREWGVVSGYADNTFRPTKIITNAEAVAFLIRTIEKIEKQEAYLEENKNNKNAVVTASVLNVREKATTSSQVVGQLKKGEIVTTQETTNGWSKIVFKGSLGYVSAEYLTPSTNNKEEVINGVYKVITKDGSSKGFSTKIEAYAYYNSNKSEKYLLENNKVVDLSAGFGRTKEYTLINDVSTGKNITYVRKDTELEIVSVESDKVIVSIAGLKGAVKKEEIDLIPYLANQELSHYMRNGKYLYHRVYENGSYDSYRVGDSPDYLKEGVPVYSFDGYSLEGKEAYQYFNYLPLRASTSYTGAQLDSFIKSVVPDSPLYGHGQTFVDAANKYNLNAVYLLSNAIHESNWGRSKIAKEKNNLFGFKAYDASPYDSAGSFATLREGIFYCAEYISNRYLQPSGVTYNNAILGNKGIGMNLKYASDPYWGQKIAGNMNKIDDFLGNKEKNKFQIGKVNKGAVAYQINGSQPYVVDTLKSNRVVASAGIVETSYGFMHKLVSDDTKFNYIYVPVSSFQKMNTY